jgi:hypothetical protein
MNNLKYYCCDEFDSWSWKYLLRQVFPKSSFVEFNQLNIKENLPSELYWMEEFRLNKVSEHKIYKSGTQHRFQLTSKIKNFILSKEYQEWCNTYFEDMSFFNEDEIELLATVSHENYVIKFMTEHERSDLKNKGINFWSDWGTLEEQKTKSSSRNKKSIFKNILDIFWAIFS